MYFFSGEPETLSKSIPDCRATSTNRVSGCRSRQHRQQQNRRRRICFTAFGKPIIGHRFFLGIAIRLRLWRPETMQVNLQRFRRDGYFQSRYTRQFWH